MRNVRFLEFLFGFEAFRYVLVLKEESKASNKKCRSVKEIKLKAAKAMKAAKA